MNDAHHISRLKQNNAVSFRYLYDKYSGLIFHIAKKMGIEKESGEEIVQDVFLKLWEKRVELDESLSIKAYLVAIAKNLVLKMIRRKMYDIAYQKYREYFFSVSTSETEDELIFEDMLQNAQKIIDKLPCAQKQIFLLHNESDTTAEEIADQLNLSKRTVENQLYRANKKILAYIRANNLLAVMFGVVVSC